MHRRSTTLVLSLAAAAALGACASKPKPGPSAPAGPSAISESQTPQPPGQVGRPDLGLDRGSQAALAAAAGDRVYFAVDSEALDEAARSALQRQAVWLSQNPSVRARIEGHADERGTREYNLALGARRANAARQFLIAQGVASTRLETISYGKERPFDAGTGEEAWARNRNAHTVVIGVLGS